MEYSLFEDVTQPGILLPLHRALTELFFVTENRAQVSATERFCSLCTQDRRGGLRSQPHPNPWGGVAEVSAGLCREAEVAAVRDPHLPAQAAPRLLILSGLRPREAASDQPLTTVSFRK